MITNVKIVNLYGKNLVSFNKNKKLVIIYNNFLYELSYNAQLLGVLKDKLVILIKNKHIAFLNFPSFSLHLVLCKTSVCSHACSESAIWYQRDDKVFQINSDMEVTLYDDFSHTHLQGIVYLTGLATLAFIVRENTEAKIFFDNPDLPTLSISEISLPPEIVFESSQEIIFSVGQSLIKYDIQKQKLQIVKNSYPLKFFWNAFELMVHYKIMSTDIILIGKNTKKIEGDVWKIVNAKNALYLFSDSINSPLRIHKIDMDAKFTQIYATKTSCYKIELKLSSREQTKINPIIVMLPVHYVKNRSEYFKRTAIFFVHGGPHQKAGNLWDPLLSEFLAKRYSVYVPQYAGTIGVQEDTTTSPSGYGLDDFQQIFLHYERIKQDHDKIIVVGHSYGAFLALKLFLQAPVDILIGINGIYDLLTIASLNPKTYAHIDEATLVSRSPKYISQSVTGNGQWHHIRFVGDPLIREVDLRTSLSRVGKVSPKIHYLNFPGHGLFDAFQSTEIVEKIKFIENQFYNTPSLGKNT
jgi:pimeloyl-ACP methyl ester carboxylesterase